jgi:hypothetical protein
MSSHLSRRPVAGALVLRCFMKFRDPASFVWVVLIAFALGVILLFVGYQITRLLAGG